MLQELIGEVVQFVLFYKQVIGCVVVVCICEYVWIIIDSGSIIVVMIFEFGYKLGLVVMINLLNVVNVLCELEYELVLLMIGGIWDLYFELFQGQVVEQVLCFYDFD